jgi:hypothetical protein
MVSINIKNRKIIITADDINPIEAYCEHRLQIGKWLITIKADSYDNTEYNFKFKLTDDINVICHPEVDPDTTRTIIYPKLFIFQKKSNDLYDDDYRRHVQVGVYIYETKTKKNNKHTLEVTPTIKENNASAICLSLPITWEEQIYCENTSTTPDKNNTQELVLTTNNKIRASLPFSIAWENKKHDGTFIAILTGIAALTGKTEEYYIEWKSKPPKFGIFENHIYKEIHKILKEVLQEKLLEKL